MILRCSTVVLAAVLATIVALSVSAVEPEKAEAASAVEARGGRTIELNAKEKRTLILHNGG